ncbi:MAG: type IV pilus modification PilV family protein [Gemmatimonadaceae bacterium]
MRRTGFTLIEVMMALVILLGVILGVAQLTAKMVHTVATSDQQLTAVQLAEGRLEQIRLDPDYTDLETNYNATETSFPTLTGFKRVTVVTHVGGAGKTQDYKKVTVTVTGPGVVSPVSRTVTVGAP